MTKTKAHNTYIAPQPLGYCSCSGAFVSQTACSPRFKLAPMALTFNQAAIRSPSLPFDGLHHRSTCNFMDYYSFTDIVWTESWVGLVCWPTADSLPTKWTPVNLSNLPWPTCDHT